MHSACHRVSHMFRVLCVGQTSRCLCERRWAGPVCADSVAQHVKEDNVSFSGAEESVKHYL